MEQALNAARKLPLPAGWIVQETRLGDGTVDYFYCNAALGLSNWDPPTLRQCLADALSSHGFKPAANEICPPESRFIVESLPASPTRGMTVVEAYQKFRQNSTGTLQASQGASVAPMTTSMSDIGSLLQRPVVGSNSSLIDDARNDIDDDNYDDMRLDELQTSQTVPASHTQQRVQFPGLPIKQAVPGQKPLRAPIHLMSSLTSKPNIIAPVIATNELPTTRDVTVGFEDTDSYYYADDYDDIEIVEEDGHMVDDGSTLKDSILDNNLENGDDHDSLHKDIVDGMADNVSTAFSIGDPSTTSIQREQRGRSEKWEMIKQAALASKDDSKKKQTNRRKFSKPPINDTGVKVLRADIVLANDRY